MKTTFKRWAGLGLGTAFLGTGLTACGGADTSATNQEPAAEESKIDQISTVEDDAAVSAMPVHDVGEGEGGEGEGEGGEGEGGEDVGTLPIPKRLAFMTGHVKAGLALYRAGRGDMAAKHLLHPVSETHAAERAGLDALGFNASVFEEVSAALDNGLPAAEIEPQLEAAEKNLAYVAAKAGGDDAEVIRYLMDTIVEEYTIAITDGEVSDPGEYQDAFGFAVVARERAEVFVDSQPQVIEELNTLLTLWPEAPIPPEDPTPIGRVIAQTSKVALALPTN